MKISNERIRQELSKSGITHSFDHWYINTCRQPQNLEKFLDDHSSKLNETSEIFTSELLLMQNKDCNLEKSEVIDLAYQSQEFGRRLTHNQEWTLWLGHPWIDKNDQEKLFNVYTRWQDGEITFLHKKKFLWHTESDTFFVERWLTKRKDGNLTPISTQKYDGLVGDKAILICYEVSKFFNEVYADRPSRIPEIREYKPDFVIAPSWWEFNKGVLLRNMRSIARRRKEERLDFMAVRPQGCIASVINHDEAYVIGPYPNGRVKAAVYGRINEPGYVRLNNDGIQVGKF